MQDIPACSAFSSPLRDRSVTMMEEALQLPHPVPAAGVGRSHQTPCSPGNFPLPKSIKCMEVASPPRRDAAGDQQGLSSVHHPLPQPCAAFVGSAREGRGARAVPAELASGRAGERMTGYRCLPSTRSTVRLAICRAFTRHGVKRASRMAMIASTITVSSSVRPHLPLHIPDIPPAPPCRASPPLARHLRRAPGAGSSVEMQ